MIDKYTFYEHRAEIQGAFAMAELDVRTMRFSGGFISDDPINKKVIIKPTHRITDRQQSIIQHHLFEKPGAVLAEAHMEITDPATQHIRECGWQQLMEWGGIICEVVNTVIVNLDTLFAMQQSLGNRRFQNPEDLERHLDEHRIRPDSLRSMIFVGTHYFECVGERPYMRANIYRVLDIRCPSPGDYEKATQVLAYAIYWNPHYAAANNQIAIISKILELSDVRLNHDRDQYGELCLHKAVFCRHQKMVELLLSRGADPTIRNHHGSNALDIEALMPCLEIREMLQAQKEQNRRSAALYEHERSLFNKAFHGH